MAGPSRWVDRQLRRRGIRDERVLAAMARVPRERFVPPALREAAYEDQPLPLPFGQTISQPYVVAFMCEGLGLAGGEHVLDVGTGSGYAAAVLEELGAQVESIELLPELAAAARKTLAAAGYPGVVVHIGDGALGLPERAPFAAVMVAAAAPAVPAPLWEQLVEGGRIAIPLAEPDGSQRLCVIVRDRGEPRLAASIPARFVPLVAAPPC